ncbi:MAG TPA: chemotaxis response regulator protein-glutamate methylesterase [Syntrophorhabdales bacterium]|nr:chemotaxis response regulator protein-glutamate methylesterase [Syntrophorhabdales bacterium]
MIRVLVVDDSPLMRRIISRILGKDPLIQLVGTAQNGEEALEKVETLQPDVVTMDIEMPRMNGLEALKAIMARSPLPVIMLSAATQEGAAVTLDALNAGACDFVPKELCSGALNITRIAEELIGKIRAVAKRLPHPPLPDSRGSDKPLAFTSGKRLSGAVVAIGASTGGPRVLQQILTSLPKDFPVPIAIAQHMPKSFTRFFAERLDALAPIKVKEAEHNERLMPGVALLAPGDVHMIVRRTGRNVIVQLVEDQSYIYRPSVDMLFTGVSEAYESKAVAVVLTGMGVDGLKGAIAIRTRNGFVIAQDEETSVVYGMPKAVAEASLTNSVVPAQEISAAIMGAL